MDTGCPVTLDATAFVGMPFVRAGPELQTLFVVVDAH